MATRAVAHKQTYCPIKGRSTPKADRVAGADCPLCGVPLPPKGGLVRVVIEDDGTVVSSEPVTKPRPWNNMKIVGPVVGAGVVIVVLIAIAAGGGNQDSGSDSASSSFSGRVLGYEPRNPAALAIELEVTNTGSATDRWECTVRAQDDSLTYKGFDIFSTDTPLAPGNSYTGVGTITITNEGAAYVTKAWVDECSSQ